jgi:hypothetical protein
MSEASEGPSWTGLVIRMGLALVWIFAAVLAAATLVRETAPWLDIVAALFLIVAPAVWCIAKAVAMKRGDELSRKVAARGLAQGLLAANIWMSVWIGAQALSSIFLGRNGLVPEELGRQALIFLAMAPAVAFLMSEAAAFALMKTYAKREA